MQNLELKVKGLKNPKKLLFQQMQLYFCWRDNSAGVTRHRQLKRLRDVDACDCTHVLDACVAL